MKTIFLLKATVRGYTRKDGTVVKPYSTKTPSAKGDTRAQGDLFGGGDRKLPPNRFRGVDPVSATPDLFDDTVTEPRKELVAEHKRLVAVLRSPSHADDKAEAKRQEAELKEYEGGARPVPDDHVRLYTGSSAGEIKEIKPEGIFGGIFASGSKQAAASHGDVHHVDVPEDLIASSRDLDQPETSEPIIRKQLNDMDDDEFSEVYDAIVFDKGLYDLDIPEERILQIFFESDLGDADWRAQKIRGQIAAALGFKAVEMKDEHGTSYLVLPGTKIYRGDGEAAQEMTNRDNKSGKFDLVSSGVEKQEVKAPEPVDKTETPAFKKWFGNSKVVDAEGKPLVVYHGNADDFSEFKDVDWSKKDQGWLGRGFYFSTDANTANSYANLKPGNGAPNVMPVYLSIKNPYEATIRDKEHGMLAERRGDKEMPFKKRDELIAQGYDGVMLHYLNNEGKVKETEYVAFHPHQIKSATGNNGDYSSHPDITKSILFLKARP